MTEYDPNTAYYGLNLHLPKNYINVEALKNALTIFLATFVTREVHNPLEEVEQILLYSESDTHLIAPRHFMSMDQLSRLGCAVKDTRPDKYIDLPFKDNVTLRNDQVDAFNAFLKADHGILSLSCGKGKTVLTLKHIAHRGEPALVIVNTNNLLEQWREEAKRHLGLKDSEIGRIQGQDCSWKGKHITLATLQTISQKYDQWPEEMKRYFGAIYWDEIHHLSARVFSRSANLFWGDRFGLTATPERSDGTHPIYYYQIGRPFHVDWGQELAIRIRFHYANIPRWEYLQHDQELRRSIRDRTGELSNSKIITQVSRDPDWNSLLMRHIDHNLKRDRRILALGPRVQQLEMLHSHYPQSGLIIGDVRAEERNEQLRKYRLVFSSMSLGKEGMDWKELDTILVLELGVRDINFLRQVLGRAQRECAGKKEPKAVFFIPGNVSRLVTLAKRARREIHRWGMDTTKVTEVI